MRNATTPENSTAIKFKKNMFRIRSVFWDGVFQYTLYVSGAGSSGIGLLIMYSRYFNKISLTIITSKKL